MMTHFSKTCILFVGIMRHLHIPLKTVIKHIITRQTGICGNKMHACMQLT